MALRMLSKKKVVLALAIQQHRYLVTNYDTQKRACEEQCNQRRIITQLKKQGDKRFNNAWQLALEHIPQRTV
jgi:hypothetical protein